MPICFRFDNDIYYHWYLRVKLRKMADTYCCMVTDIAKKLTNANTVTL